MGFPILIGCHLYIESGPTGRASIQYQMGRVLQDLTKSKTCEIDVKLFASLWNLLSASTAVLYSSHGALVMVVSTYVPTKMGWFFLASVSIQVDFQKCSVSKRVKIYQPPFIDRYLNGSLFHLSVGTQRVLILTQPTKHLHLVDHCHFN